MNQRREYNTMQPLPQQQAQSVSKLCKSSELQTKQIFCQKKKVNDSFGPQSCDETAEPKHVVELP